MAMGRCNMALFSPMNLFSFAHADSAATIQMLGQSSSILPKKTRLTPQLLAQVGQAQSKFACAVFPQHSPVKSPVQSIFNKGCENQQLECTFASASHDGITILPRDTAEKSGSRRMRTDLQVVLVSPQIPGNTGCIARSCAAAGVGLHLVEPLGFEITSAKLKRAGLEYWPYVVVKVHKSWAEFFSYFEQQEGAKRLLAFTKSGNTCHTVTRYKRGDWLLFGSETDGLPDEAIHACSSSKYGGGLLRIPIDETYVRCLNLSVAAGIGVYEALRQLGYPDNLLNTPTQNSLSFTGQDVFS